MTSGSKSIAVLIITLLLGMVLGALGFSVYQRQRFRDALSMTRPAHFTASIEQALEPIDDDKREAIRAALRTIDEGMRAQRRARDEGRRAHLDSIEAALLPLLDEDQRQRLQQHVAQHTRFIKRGGSRPPRRGPDGSPRRERRRR